MNVYSTVAGELPLMVAKGAAECFIPYSQGLAMQVEIDQLKKDLVKMQAEHEVAIAAHKFKQYSAGYDDGRKIGAVISGSRIDDVHSSVENLRKTVDSLTDFVGSLKEAK